MEKDCAIANYQRHQPTKKKENQKTQAATLLERLKYLSCYPAKVILYSDKLHRSRMQIALYRFVSLYSPRAPAPPHTDAKMRKKSRLYNVYQ